LGGTNGSLKFSHTKNPKPGQSSKYVMFDLEDVDGVMRCILWPNDFEKFGHLVQPEAVLVARGQLDRRGGDTINMIVNELIPLDDLASRYTAGCIIRIDEDQHAADVLPKLREILRGYPGPREVKFCIALSDGARVILRSPKTPVEITSELQARIDDLLGAGNFQRITAAPQANTKPKGPAKFGRS
jgi:DNA polymerase-3 subunit alpha